MKDKVMIVTGANSGIGLETARELATAGATVVMVARSQERGAAALADVKQSSGNPNVHLMLCDLSNQKSIRAFAAKFLSQYDRLDVLVNNAGAIFADRKESVDGIELTFALNHMGYFLLTDLLLDVLKASAPSRIVNVSSDAHSVGTFDFDDYQRMGKYSRLGFQEYGESKMANVLFTYELAKRLEGTSVTVNALHPGFVRTNFAANNGRFAKLMVAVFGRFLGISQQKGAETPVYLATSAEVATVTGKYFYEKQQKNSHRFSYDESNQRRLWELSEQLLTPV